MRRSRALFIAGVAVAINALAASSVAGASSPKLFHSLGVNGVIVTSRISQANADTVAQAQWVKNPAYVAAGDYVGYDVTPQFTNPADMVLIFGPTRVLAEKNALAFGKKIVEGGSQLATSPNGVGVITAPTKARAIALASSVGSELVSTYFARTSSGQVMHSAWKAQWASVIAGYVPYAAKGLPTKAETCRSSSTPSQTVKLLSWECPAGWKQVKAAA